MVEGNKLNLSNDNTCNINPIVTPEKKFYKKQQDQEQEVIPVIPPRPLLAPKLPIKSNNNNGNNNSSSSNSRSVKSSNSYPSEDDIYTGMKPELTINKFYFNSNVTAPMSLPADFIAKAFVNQDTVVGIQHGRIVQFCADKSSLVDGMFCESSSNRQFYELIQVNQTLLAFQDTGTVYKIQMDGRFGSLKMLLRDSIPMGTTTKIILRPEINEIWVAGFKETSILAVNKDKDIALVRKVPTHFPEAAALIFLDAEELAVLHRDRTVQIYSLPRFGHAPALIANIPAVVGDIVKVIRVPDDGDSNAYGTIYSDGKIIIWKFKTGKGLTEKITVPLTLFRIQTVHFSKDLLWLGLNNGKIIVVEIKNTKKIGIVCEMKNHQMTVNKFIKTYGNSLISVDAGGQICSWDENLSFYKQNKFIWEREADYCQYERVSVRICSWNAAAQNPADCIDSVGNKWFGSGTDSPEDLIIISLQEIVDLSARKFINDSQNQTNVLDQWIKFAQKRLPNEYKLVHSSMMVGLGLIVFCRDAIKGSLSSVSDDSVKTGLGGLHGNKGGLTWRTFIYDTPVAIVACHLAAGLAAVSERNTDAATILRTATFSEATNSRKDPFAFPTGNTGTRLFDHSAVFFAGDLNYRIEMDRQDCLEKISEGNFKELEAKDQLNAQLLRKELLLSYFGEQRPTFAPTYKYDRGTVDRFDSSEKARVPAWCDRILFYSKLPETIIAKKYDSILEATLSDHKPIYATFELKCRRINHPLRSNLLRNY